MQGAHGGLQSRRSHPRSNHPRAFLLLVTLLSINMQPDARGGSEGRAHARARPTRKHSHRTRTRALQRGRAEREAWPKFEVEACQPSYGGAACTRALVCVALAPRTSRLAPYRRPLVEGLAAAALESLKPPCLCLQSMTRTCLAQAFCPPPLSHHAEVMFSTGLYHEDGCRPSCSPHAAWLGALATLSPHHTASIIRFPCPTQRLLPRAPAPRPPTCTLRAQVRRPLKQTEVRVQGLEASWACGRRKHLSGRQEAGG